MSTRWWQQGLRAGKLLVATPEITSGVFHMSVVFLIEHDPTDSAFSADSADGGGGSLGVVLNRPTRTPVGAVLADWHDLMTAPSVLHEGGPVQTDGALCLGRLHPSTADAVPRGVRPTTGDVGLVDLDADTEVVAPQVSALRVFAGHSGWEAGQLAEEVADGAWFVVPARASDLFSPEPEQLWRTVLRRQPAPLWWLMTFPDDPADN